MRFLIQATIPSDIANKMVENDADSLKQAEKCIKTFNPEAAYFRDKWRRRYCFSVGHT